MCECQLQNHVIFLDDVRQGETESLAKYYSRFYKNLANIDQVIYEGEIVRAFMRGLIPKGLSTSKGM